MCFVGCAKCLCEKLNSAVDPQVSSHQGVKASALFCCPSDVKKLLLEVVQCFSMPMRALGL